MTSDRRDEFEPTPHTMRRTRTRIRALARFVGPYRRMFALSIATAIGTTACAALIPFLFRHAMDDGGLAGDARSAQLWVGLALAATVAGWGFAVLNTLWSFWSVRVVNDLRVALYAHVNRQGLDFFSSRRTGTVISRLTNDVEALAQIVHDGVFMVFVNVLQVVLIQAFLFAMDWRLALAVNVIFPPMLVATWLFRRSSTRAYKATRERMALVTAFVAESLSGMRVVQAFAAEERAAAEFDRTNTHYRRANMETVWLNAAYFPGVDLLAAAGTAIVLWYGGHLARVDAVELGVLVAFLIYLENFFDPVQQLSQFYGSFLSAMAALDKIMDVMETEPTIVDRPDARTLRAVHGDVTFHDVTFRYAPDGPDVLEQVDLDVPAGSTVAIVGHTGAGKSTLVKLLTRFHDPTSGSVTLDGVDLRDLEQRWLRRSMGIVPQEGFLFDGTIAQNIAYARPDAPRADVERAARSVGAHELVEAFESGYDTQVGERGSRLSAGERQLVAFARAMLADPRLLVLDEATSSVDVATELRLASGLRALVAGRTAFVVAHRLSTVRDADVILVVDEGRIVEHGSHDELVGRAGGAYAALYATWSDATIERRLADHDDDTSKR